MKANHVSPSVLKVTSCRRARGDTDKQARDYQIIFNRPSVSVVDENIYTRTKLSTTSVQPPHNVV